MLNAWHTRLPLALQKGMLNASSKPVVCVALQTSLEIPTGEATSMIFFVMLLPLLASEASRHDGLIED